MSTEKKYLILSLKYSGRSNYWVWWGPNNGGYTESLSDAGRYTEEQVRSDPTYYNDHENTLAVAEDDVRRELRVHEVVSRSDLEKLRAAGRASFGEPRKRRHAAG